MKKDLTIIETRFKELKEKGLSTLIPDGIVNIEKYNNAKIKIMWVLKEPHDENNGGWDMREFLSRPENLTQRKDNWQWKRTYKMLMLVTWGILHNLQSYDKTLNDWGRIGDEKMLSILNDIAYINLKKTSGNSGSYEPEIRAAYKTNKEMIWLQINTIKPDIVICGGTYKFIKNDIKLLSKNQSAFISNNHPNLRGHKRDADYYNEIMTEIKQKTEVN